MPSINLLPDHLINKIAAGEVVERPASIVKELLENSLDAGAKNIDVEIAEGGKKSICIKDDGLGIAPDELIMAVSRHATSKIASEDDLFSIHTMGFRGEALASIASVAQMTMTSRAREGRSSAHQISLDGGEIISNAPAAHPFGTTVLVKYLFHHTPARLKFLKSPETETTHIVDLVTKLALGHLQTSIRIFSNGKKILETHATDSFKQRVSDLFGGDVAKNCFEMSHSPQPPFTLRVGEGAPSIQLSGLVSHPQIARPTQKQIYLLVNGRAVKDKVVTHAVMEAYRNYLMHGRYPFVVLNLTIDPKLVDVNVHPAKAEVRFADSQGIHRLVSANIRTTLEAEPWKEMHTEDSEVIQQHHNTIERVVVQNYQANSPQPPLILRGGDDDNASRFTFHASRPTETPHQSSIPYANLQILGQLLGTYILCQGNEKLVLIDQHAAHERIGFEKLLKEHAEGEVATAQMLVPETIDLKPAEVEVLKQYLEDLKKSGLEIDFFGGNTFVIRSVPVLFQGKINIKNLILDLIADLGEKGKMSSVDDTFRTLFASMSCHGAIRANHRLSFAEMQALIAELEEYPGTSFCPHGRPVAVEVEKQELEKWFKRIV